MSPQEREKVYDDEIAPALRDLAKRCESVGMSFLAVAEWEPGEIGRTAMIVPGSGVGLRIVDAAAQSNGNVDSLILSIMRHAREHGHGSVCLKLLGVPHKPGGEP